LTKEINGSSLPNHYEKPAATFKPNQMKETNTAGFSSKIFLGRRVRGNSPPALS